MLRKLALWVTSSVVGGATITGLAAATHRAIWLISHNNVEALLWKPTQLFFVIGAHALVATAVWGIPAIILWVYAARWWPRVANVGAAPAVVPAALTGLIAATTLPVVSDIPPGLLVAAVLSVAFPPLILRSLREPGS